MFEYKEFELLAQLYVERQDDAPETEAIAKGVDMDDLTAGVYSAANAFRKIAFIAGMHAVIRMLAMALCKGEGKVL